MTLIDTNVILRYLLNDVPEQAEQAKAVIEAGAFTTIEVIAEVVYLLRKAYQSDREKIYLSIMKVADEISITEYDVLMFAMECFRRRNLDFVDCVIAARALELRKNNCDWTLKRKTPPPVPLPFQGRGNAEFPVSPP